jgi:hypothetical protein
MAFKDVPHPGVASEIFKGSNALTGDELTQTISTLFPLYLNDTLLSVDNFKLLYIDQIATIPARSHATFTPSLSVINTAHKKQPGQHWFAVFALSPTVAYSFDSYGRPVDQILAIQNVYVPDGLKDIVNVSAQRLQNVSSVVCGHYIIDFIDHLKKQRHTTCERGWQNFIHDYHPINDKLEPSMAYIDKVTTINDVHCFLKVCHLFPQLRH